VGGTDADAVNERNDQPFHSVRKKCGCTSRQRESPRDGLTGAGAFGRDYLASAPLCLHLRRSKAFECEAHRDPLSDRWNLAGRGALRAAASNLSSILSRLMAFWDNPLLRKTILFMLAGVLSLAAIIAMSLWLTFKVQANADDAVRARQISNQAAAVLSLVTDAETGQRGFLLVDEPKYLAPYQDAVRRLPDATNGLVLLAEGTPSFHEAADRASTLIKSKMEELAETIALVRNGQRAKALDVVRTDRGKAAMDAIRDVVGSIVANSDMRVSTLFDQGKRAATALFWVNTISSVLIALVTVAAAWIVARYATELIEARTAVIAANTSLEARVAERTIDLARANEEIQRFAYIVSHDLRAPLVNVVGFTAELEAGAQVLQRFISQAAVAQDDAALAAEARTAAAEDLPEAIGFIRASTTKMDRLINAILKLSREGRRELRPEPIDLKAMFEAIAASVQHQLEQAAATIAIDSKMPTIQSDRLALEQVFGNLIDNAVKYFSPARPGKIDVRASSDTAFVTVDVIDNGRGIAASDHERIFELFRRSGTQDVPGEGIGLAHVRALVRRLGGDITVTSDIGHGSRFCVKLPRIFVRRNNQEHT
jgi:signal transduction histidine kinase